jgi:hypothetical protein
MRKNYTDGTSQEEAEPEVAYEESEHHEAASASNIEES